MPDTAALIEEAKKAAAHYGIPENVFLQQIQTESSFNPNAFNPNGPSGGAIGIAQFIGPTAQQYGVSPYDPVQSLWGAAAYDADLFKQKGSWAGVLQSYGTVPASGPQNQQQQAALSAAQAADSGIAGGGIIPAAFPGSAGGLGSLIPNIPGAIGGAIGSAVSGIGAFIWNLALRIILVLIGIVLIWQGLAMMRGSSVKENITVVVRAAKNRKAKAV